MYGGRWKKEEEVEEDEEGLRGNLPERELRELGRSRSKLRGSFAIARRFARSLVRWCASWFASSLPPCIYAAAFASAAKSKGAPRVRVRRRMADGGGILG